MDNNTTTKPIPLEEAIIDAGRVWSMCLQSGYDSAVVESYEHLKTLERFRDGEIIHPHTVALAKIDSPYILRRHRCVGCPAVDRNTMAGSNRSKDSVEPHADDCAWVEARRILDELDGGAA